MNIHTIERDADTSADQWPSHRPVKRVAHQPSAAPLKSRRHSITWVVVVATLAVVLAMAYGPLLVEFIAWQQQRPHYHASIFPLLACFALLGWRGAMAPTRSRGLQSDRLTLSMLVASLLLLTVAVLLHSPLVAFLSAIMLAGAACSELGARREVTNLWGIWSLLWLIVPIPLGQDRVLISRLQLWSSQLCSAGLDWLGVLHLMEGNKLSLAGGELFVDEACSGIVSVLLVVSLAAIYGVARNRPAAHLLLLAASGVAWATLLNAVRIGTIAIALDWHQLDWSTGWAHEWLGAITALLAIGATVATDQLLLAFLAPIQHEYEAATAQPLVHGGLLAKGWDWFVQLGPRSAAVREAAPLKSIEPLCNQSHSLWSSRRLLCAVVPFALVAGLAWGLPAPDRASIAVGTSEHQNVVRALAMDAKSLPGELATGKLVHHHLVRRDSHDQFGEYSSIYEYQADDGTPIVISCDFPFPTGWHELSVCYEGIGWELLSRDVRHAPSGGSYAESHFRLPDGGRAAVFYSAFDSHGDAMEPPSQSLGDTLARAFSRRQTRSGTERVFQVQLLITSPVDHACSEARLDVAGQMLIAAEEHFRQHILSRPDLSTR